MSVRIGTNEAVAKLRDAGYAVTQLDRGALLAYRDDECYGMAWRTTEHGKGYCAEVVDALVARPRKSKAA